MRNLAEKATKKFSEKKERITEKMKEFLEKYAGTIKELREMDLATFSEKFDCHTKIGAVMLQKMMVGEAYFLILAAPLIVLKFAAFLLIHFTEIACWGTMLAFAATALIEIVKYKPTEQAFFISELEARELTEKLQQVIRSKLIFLNGCVENGVRHIIYTAQDNSVQNAIIEAVLRSYLENRFQAPVLKTYVQTKLFGGLSQIHLYWAFTTDSAGMLQKKINSDALLDLENQKDIYE